MAAFAFASIASASLRVASLDLCADEYLLLLARPGEVAAVSRLSHDRAESPLWRRARAFPAHNGRIEALLPHRPTLLVAVAGPGGRSTAAIARRLGMAMLTLPYPEQPADAVANARRLASALSDPARAAWIERRFEALAAAPPQRDTLFLGGGGMSVAPDGLSAGWMRLAGFRQRALPGGRATLEQLATRPPAVLLRSDYRSGQMSLGQRWLDHPLVRHGRSRTIVTDGRAWTCGGPLMIGEIERLRKVR